MVSLTPFSVAQEPGAARFEVVSIKRNTSGTMGGSARSLPDGTEMMVNQPVRGFLASGAPVPVRDVVGYPDWVMNERYDITAKPPEGYDRSRSREMMRNMLIDRMKLAGHVEEREQNTFALVFARKDEQFGPGLQPSTANCARTPGTPPPTGPPENPDFKTGCFMRMGPGMIEGGAMSLDSLGFSLGGLAGGLVNNRTGLTGLYRVSLTFKPQNRLSTDRAAGDDAPDIFTAIQEQLGLKLQSEKTMVPVFVIDHIERPTEN